MASFRTNLHFAKRFFTEQVLAEVFNYIDDNPDANFPRVMKFVQRIAASQPLRLHQVNLLIDAYEHNPAIHATIARLFALHPNVKQRMLYNWFINAQILGVPWRSTLSKEYGVHLPNFVLLDPTSACNLRCTGCWAGAYAHHDTLELPLVDRICTEMKELGIYWLAMSGGEPFCWPHLLDLARKHADMAFMLYTNGTLIDERMADSLQEVGNVSPAISLEGWRESTDARRGQGVFHRILRVMDLLRERGVLFGISLTITRQNADEVTSDAFFQFLIDQGALYGWSFHYIPIGRNPDTSLMVTAEQREMLIDRIIHIRRDLGFPIADFWNDGELTGGCIAGGRHYLHITASGDVEPCAFFHFTTHNIRHMSLRAVLDTPLFHAFQQRQPFSENLLRVCPIIDHPEQLRAIVAETGARPSHEGADSLLEPPLADFLDAHAARWERASCRRWHSEPVDAVR